MKHKPGLVYLLHITSSSISVRPIMWSKVCWIASVVFLVAMLFMGIMGRMDNNSVGQIVSMMVFILFFWIPCGAYHIHKRCRSQIRVEHEASNFVYNVPEDVNLEHSEFYSETGSERICLEGDFMLIPQSPVPPYRTHGEDLNAVQTDFDSDPPPPYEEEPPPTYEESIVAALANGSEPRDR